MELGILKLWRYLSFKNLIIKKVFVRSFGNIRASEVNFKHKTYIYFKILNLKTRFQIP